MKFILAIILSVNAKEYEVSDGKHFRAHYSLPALGLTVTKASPDEVNEICSAVKFQDNGIPILPGMGSFSGCCFTSRHFWFWKKSRIIVRWDDVGAKALIHELHHAAGIPVEEVEKIDWDIPREEDGV